MSLDPTNRRVHLALKRAIKATFTQERWIELGYLTDTSALITGHPRLLRSQAWGDEDDYGVSIFGILEDIVTGQTIDVIERFVGLADWLRANDPEFYNELYASDMPHLDDLVIVGTVETIPELIQQVQRIRGSISSDPALAMGSAKELLETVLKTVLEKYGTKSTENVPTLVKQAIAKLDLEFSVSGVEVSGRESLKRTVGGLSQVVVGVAELRNLYGTGHGRSRALEADATHARLVVEAAATVGRYFLEMSAAHTTHVTIR